MALSSNYFAIVRLHIQSGLASEVQEFESAEKILADAIIIQTKRNEVGVPERVDPRIADVEAIARWFDYAFVLPGGFRFGFAGIIGLVPGIGDLIDALVSLYIVHRAIQLGIPRATLARMVLNVGIEGVAGSVPFLGDLFDVAFKANRRNYHILKNHLAAPKRQSRLDWLFLAGAAALGILAIALPLIALVALIRHFS